jgi:hypothetical protein
MTDMDSLTPEQLAAWRRGELIIEFCFDEPPQVNQQDFERWVQERQIKPNLTIVNGVYENATFDNTHPTWEVEPLGHCIK